MKRDRSNPSFTVGVVTKTALCISLTEARLASLNTSDASGHSQPLLIKWVRDNTFPLFGHKTRGDMIKCLTQLPALNPSTLPYSDFLFPSAYCQLQWIHYRNEGNLQSRKRSLKTTTFSLQLSSYIASHSCYTLRGRQKLQR